MPMLPRKELLPAEHIVDTGYVDAKLLLESEPHYHLDSGRVRPEKITAGKPAEPTGFDADHFLIDWEQQQASLSARTH
jgi:transposase